MKPPDSWMELSKDQREQLLETQMHDFVGGRDADVTQTVGSAAMRIKQAFPNEVPDDVLEALVYLRDVAHEFESAWNRLVDCAATAYLERDDAGV